MIAEFERPRGVSAASPRARGFGSTDAQVTTFTIKTKKRKRPYPSLNRVPKSFNPPQKVTRLSTTNV